MQKDNMKKIEPSTDTYSSTDFYSAAYLICSGLALLKTERVGYNRVVFVLQDSPKRAQLIQDFYGHKAKIDPLLYKDTLTNLKAIIHSV